MSYVEVNEEVTILTPSYDKRTLRGFNIIGIQQGVLSLQELRKEAPIVMVEFESVKDIDRMIKALNHIKRYFPSAGTT